MNPLNCFGFGKSHDVSNVPEDKKSKKVIKPNAQQKEIGKKLQKAHELRTDIDAAKGRIAKLEQVRQDNAEIDEAMEAIRKRLEESSSR